MLEDASKKERKAERKKTRVSYLISTLWKYRQTLRIIIISDYRNKNPCIGFCYFSSQLYLTTVLVAQEITFAIFINPNNNVKSIILQRKKKKEEGKERNIAMETRINEYPLRLTRRGIVFCLRRGFPRSPAVPADITMLEYVCYKENETTNGRPVLQSDTFARGRPVWVVKNKK